MRIFYLLILFVLFVGRQYPVSAQLEGDQAGYKTDYLIICTDSLKDAFEPLLEWKFRKGLRVEIVSVEEIYASYAYPTQPLSIKHYLHDKYLNNNLKWVLLGGDHNHIPVQYTYGKFGNEIEDYRIPTDLFYACFDQRFDWNSNRDSIVGQPYVDANDVIPDIFLTRLPARNREDITTFVKKTINYETQAPDKNFYGKLLLAGVKSWYNWNGKSDNHYRSEYLYNHFIADNWKGEKYGYYDTGTDFPQGSGYNVTARNIGEQLNEGYAFFHFAGHGNLNSFSMESGESFTVGDVSGLEHEGYSVLLSTACDISAFDSIDPCLSEAFLRNKNGGAIAVFASSRYGIELKEPSLNLGPSFNFNAKFLKILLSEKENDDLYSFGAISGVTKTEFLENGSDRGAYWYLIYAINPLGDPEMPLFNRPPDEFLNVRIYRTGNELTVNTGGIPDCRICISRYDSSMKYQDVKEHVSYTTFYNVPEHAQVTITKPNYIPYIFVVDETVSVSYNITNYVSIYPNPVDDLLNIELSANAARYTIFSIHSVRVKSGKLKAGSNQVDLGFLDTGPYILKIDSKSGSANFVILVH